MFRQHMKGQIAGSPVRFIISVMPIAECGADLSGPEDTVLLVVGQLSS
jgi:hypothetical protein